MDKYNLPSLTNFMLKYVFQNYAIITDCVLTERRNDHKWHMVWGEPAEKPEYNKSRTQTTIWAKIIQFDPEYGKMSARQKVELVDMIIRKLEVA